MGEREVMMAWAAKKLAEAEKVLAAAEQWRREWEEDVERLERGEPTGRFQLRYWSWKGLQPREASR